MNSALFPRDSKTLDAYLDAIAEEMARRDLLRFVMRMFSAYRPAPHHRLIADTLWKVITGQIKRLIITMPPRHGKSTLASEFFPPFYLAHHPTHRVIATSYAVSLAYLFSRRARNIFEHPLFPFHHVKVAGDRGAVENWELAPSDEALRANPGLEYRGGYLAAGVGGGVTGHGANLLVIDDPVKSIEEADSIVKRDRVWDWYTGTAYTRLQPGGAVVIIGCMVGDTSVTMADGSVKPIRDIAIGDEIASYDDGRICSSRVLNWINHGPDYTFKITTKSGIILKANARHPFLVDCEGVRTWKRLRDLKPGDILVRAHCREGHGPALNAQSMDARISQNVKDIAQPITTRRAGQAGIERPQSMPRTRAGRISDTAMVSITPIMTECSQSSGEGALSAIRCLNPQPEQPESIAEKKNCLSIIATKPARFVDCCAMNAILPLDIVEASPSFSQPLDTFGIDLDSIIDIAPDGAEDVFDIEVERTENFIANGVVSHNTRWHHDDLIGRILESEEGKEFTVLHLPAIGADGSALWPEMYPLETLQKIRAVIGSRNFNAQYQGTPTEDEGGIVRWNWLAPYVRPPEDIADIWQSWDTSFGGSSSADYSACLTVGNSPRSLSLLSLWRKQVEFPQLVEKCIDLWREWEPSEVLIENKASGQSLIQVLAQMPEARSMPVIPILPIGDKIARLYRVAPFIESGRVNRPQYAYWLEEFKDELTKFPLSANDDQVDAFSQIVARAFGLDDIGIAESTSYVQRSRYDEDEIDRAYARMRG